MEAFFDACLERIVQLILDHMKEIEAVASGKPKVILLSLPVLQNVT
jgi:hypothetical protein